MIKEVVEVAIDKVGNQYKPHIRLRKEIARVYGGYQKKGLKNWIQGTFPTILGTLENSGFTLSTREMWAKNAGYQRLYNNIDDANVVAALYQEVINQ